MAKQQPPAMEFFQQLAIRHQESWICDRVRVILPNIFAASNAPSPTAHGELCYVGETGDFVTNALNVLSQLATVVVQSEEFVLHLNSRAILLAEEADLSGVAALDEKHLALKSVIDHIGSTAIACEALWNGNVGENVDISATGHFAGNDQPEGVYIPPPDGQPGIIDSVNEAEESSHLPISLDNLTMEQDAPRYHDSELRKRGKGSYFCPDGLNCTKGGVTDSGEAKEFYRNSDFRDHMQKHEKPYRCDLPNCLNTTGFARLDQLERHKQKVKHSQSGWKVQQYS